MTAHQGFRVAATTAGIASSPYEHLRVNYVYGGEDREAGPSQAAREPAGSPVARAAAKRERLAAYFAARDDGLDQVQAAERTGIKRRTMNRYELDYQAAKAAGS